MQVKDIIGQHSKSVALVFARNGFKGTPTAKDLMLATLMQGEPFIDELAAQIAEDTGEYQQFGPAKNDEPTGSMAAEVTLPTVVVRNKSQKVKKTLLELLKIGATAAGTFLAAKGAKNTPDQNNNTPNNYQQPIIKQAKKTQWVLIGAVVLIVVLGAILLKQKNK